MVCLLPKCEESEQFPFLRILAAAKRRNNQIPYLGYWRACRMAKFLFEKMDKIVMPGLNCSTHYDLIQASWSYPFETTDKFVMPGYDRDGICISRVVTYSQVGWIILSCLDKIVAHTAIFSRHNNLIHPTWELVIILHMASRSYLGITILSVFSKRIRLWCLDKIVAHTAI